MDDVPEKYNTFKMFVLKCCVHALVDTHSFVGNILVTSSCKRILQKKTVYKT